MTIEFMAILFVLITYLAVVFSLFSSTKNSLEEAADRKLEKRLSSWIKFIDNRPEGTEIRLDFTPYPGRYLGIMCGNPTTLDYPSGTTTTATPSSCPSLNMSGKTCLSIESVQEGVKIEIC